MSNRWKDIEGFEGLYKISEDGKVWSIPRMDIKNRQVGGNIVTPKTNNRGYWQIRLNKDGTTHHFLVHRLVAQTFIPNTDKLPQVNHKDENRDNNHYSNLEWCTNLYNRHYGTGYQRSVENHDYKAMGERCRKPVVQKDLEGNVLKVWDWATEAEKATKIHKDNIRRVCSGRGTSAGGYLWSYA